MDIKEQVTVLLSNTSEATLNNLLDENYHSSIFEYANLATVLKAAVDDNPDYPKTVYEIINITTRNSVFVMLKGNNSSYDGMEYNSWSFVKETTKPTYKEI
ncbi:MAG: hypothetical protein PF440_06830 [Thiomicrorhabdus sp.]|jgi:hypothetical protein|nr:hypothetical protein [Thiomicrorhabdus sp.]